MLRRRRRPETSCEKLPLISPQHWSVDRGFDEDVDVAESAEKHSVRMVAAAWICGQPRVAAVLNQNTKHSALCLRQVQELYGNLEKTTTTTEDASCKHFVVYHFVF